MPLCGHALPTLSGLPRPRQLHRAPHPRCPSGPSHHRRLRCRPCCAARHPPDRRRHRRPLAAVFLRGKGRNRPAPVRLHRPDHRPPRQLYPTGPLRQPVPCADLRRRQHRRLRLPPLRHLPWPYLLCHCPHRRPAGVARCHHRPFHRPGGRNRRLALPACHRRHPPSPPKARSRLPMPPSEASWRLTAPPCKTPTASR